MAILYFTLDTTEGYTDAELAAFNKELDAYVEMQREEAEAANDQFWDEERASKEFHTIVARR